MVKGPVFYDRDVIASAAHSSDVVTFGLALAGETRSAIVGTWRGVQQA
jgi:hypothetical protein